MTHTRFILPAVGVVLSIVRLMAAAPCAAAAPTDPPFWTWAQKPPMGWNSWDGFATTVTEAQTRAQIEVMASQLHQHGWQYIVVDIQWYEPNATGFDYRKDAKLEMDAWGRLLPAANKFPSAANGQGFAALAAYAHQRGLKFGVHLMRGIPRQAVAAKTPIQGTSYTAADIADTQSVCPWNGDMYGVDMSRPGAQAYYDSVFAQFAQWGLDFVKVDDLSTPYHQPEIEAIRRAIDRTGRPIVLSTSPGATPLSDGASIQDNANMWRISGDFWDNWPQLLSQFDRLRDWTPYRAPGHFPDADMLPIGVLQMGKSKTHFSPSEQFTLLTLWSIARSPLMVGADLTKLDDFTLSLLTNDEVLSVNQDSANNRELFHRDGFYGWIADVPGSRDKYLALFNTRSLPGELDAGRALYQSPPLSLRTPSADRKTTIDVNISGAKKLYLVVDGDRGAAAAIWSVPVLVIAGQPRSLTAVPWVSATTGGNLKEPEVGTPHGAAEIRTRSRSVIEYDLPADCTRFQAVAGIEDAGNTGAARRGGRPGSGLRFMVFTQSPFATASSAPVPVPWADLGLGDTCYVRDLWARKDIGTVSSEFAPVLPAHGAGLYRITPRRTAR